MNLFTTGLSNLPLPDCVVRGNIHSWAIFSADDRYRYVLCRRFFLAPPDVYRPLVVCGLNPSTADELTDDPTIRKLTHYAKRDRFHGLVMINAFALRATDPSELANALNKGIDPAGPQNDFIVERCAIAWPHAMVAVAWGKPKKQPKRLAPYIERAARILATANANARQVPLACYGTNKDGSPKHPLYLRNDTKLREWKGPKP